MFYLGKKIEKVESLERENFHINRHSDLTACRRPEKFREIALIFLITTDHN